LAALGHLLLVLGFRLPARPLPIDASFGLYIYGWPVTQMLAHQMPWLSAPALAALALAATLPLAALSWQLVERPALLRHRPARA
jgi:peptidoglycan/LPS O-acetylase OafA/YrhL